jgi:ribosome maturation factor RimP
LPHPLIADLESLAAAQALAADLQVVAVHLHSHRIPMTVQVMLRRSDGGDVSLDACAAFSGPLGEAIEGSELLESPYVLEVSSPGIDEELTSDRDFTSFRGFPVAVTVDDGQGTEQIREGLLLGRDALEVRLNVRGRTLRLNRASVTHVRLVSPRDGP